MSQNHLLNKNIAKHDVINYNIILITFYLSEICTAKHLADVPCKPIHEVARSVGASRRQILFRTSRTNEVNEQSKAI